MIAVGAAMALSGVGLAEAIAGAVAVRSFTSAKPAIPSLMELPPVTVLKPLHGDEPLLEQALASVCRQDYPAAQIVFGVQDADDPALAVARRVQLQHPDRDVAIVVDPRIHGPNRKVGNLINMLATAKHDVLVISDSDVHAPADWLRSLVAGLSAPRVGLVTTVYTGLPVPGPHHAARAGIFTALGAMQINQYFLPGAVLGRLMGRQDCLGASMILRRDTLRRIGGFDALVGQLADDNILGRLVQRLDLGVALADTIPATTVCETTFLALWRHELRWARTIRALVPLQFAASALQYPLAWALLAMLFTGGAHWAFAWLALAWGVRAFTVRAIDRRLALANPTPLWLLPVRELMSVAMMAASFAGRRVEWRGHILKAEGFHAR